MSRVTNKSDFIFVLGVRSPIVFFKTDLEHYFLLIRQESRGQSMIESDFKKKSILIRKIEKCVRMQI